MNADQIWELFHHETRYWWLRLRLIEESRTEPVREMLRLVRDDAKRPRTRFILDDNLRRLLNL